MSTKILIPTPLVKVCDTIPAQIVDMKIYPLKINPFDITRETSENIMFEFTYSEHGLEQTLPTHFLIELFDIDTQESKSSMISAVDGPYSLWTGFFEWWVNMEKELEDTVDNMDLSNYRAKVTPINDAGVGPSSIFFIPFRDTLIENSSSGPCFYRNDTIVLNWSLFSETPDERKNRPKVMHIYLDVTEDEVLNDRDLLSQDEYHFTGVGNWRTTNELQYRWLLNDSGSRKLTGTGWVDCTQQEEEFIVQLLKDMQPTYMHELAVRGLAYGDPIVFKALVENPTDNKDSIQIYLMKETTWEL